MAPHSSTLAWKIPWTEEPGRPQSMGSLRVGQDWATSLALVTVMHWRRKWQPTPVFLPGESQGRGAWWAAIYGVAQSRTRLKWLSSSSRTKKYPICPLLDPHSPQRYHSSDVWCDGFISLLKITSSSLKERAQTREAIKDMNILVRNYESPPSIKDIVNDILYIFSHRIIPTTMFYIMVSFRGSPCFPRNGI